jgi:MoaA/NifB/PqqE/SkfB family radical SAM enzyme
MNPDLFAMVSAASTRGIEVEFSTNAVLLSAAASRNLILSGLSYLTISLDGATADTYERIRVGARFATVVENIAQLTRIKKQLHRRRPIACINMVVSRENLHELDDLLYLAQTLDIARVRASVLEPPNQELAAAVPDALAWREATRRADRLARRLRIVLEHYGVFPWAEDFTSWPASTGARCTRPWLAPFIRLDGYVTPCCNISDWQTLGGLNVFDESFPSIWNSSAFQTFRDMLTHGPLPVPCRQCPQR